MLRTITINYNDRQKKMVHPPVSHNFSFFLNFLKKLSKILISPKINQV